MHKQPSPGWPPIQRCPACGGSVDGHWYAIVGGANAGTSAGHALHEAFLQHDWAGAMKQPGGAPTADFLVIVAIKCGARGSLSVAEIMSYFEMWMDDEALGVASLSAEASTALDALIADEAWRQIEW